MEPVAENGCLPEPSHEDDFVTVAKVGTIPPGEGRAFPVSGRMIAIFRHADGYFAIDDCCPHMGAPLSSGYLDGDAVICPWHAWQFCVKDGLWLDNPKSNICSLTFAVRVVGDEIQVCKTAHPKQHTKGGA